MKRRNQKRRTARGQPNVRMRVIGLAGHTDVVLATAAGARAAQACWLEGRAAAHEWLAAESYAAGDFRAACERLQIAHQERRAADSCRLDARRLVRKGYGPASFRIDDGRRS